MRTPYPFTLFLFLLLLTACSERDGILPGGETETHGRVAMADETLHTIRDVGSYMHDALQTLETPSTPAYVSAMLHSFSRSPYLLMRNQINVKPAAIPDRGNHLTALVDQANSMQELISLVQSRIAAYRDDYILQGSQEAYVRLVEAAYFHEVLVLSRSRELSGAIYPKLSWKCFGAVAGGAIAGGLSGCMAGGKAGVAMGAQGAAGGCAIGGVIGGISGGLLGYAEAC
ncbi:hypothetical protein [Lewinella sp. IMCC34183]|uniref:hypothetical protein n=1 Tax=Lewinella sp. IMCC34183 TaxID=2248762 RepID=UPI000E279549|nr:hypothetical protein [Lewinella sp. IMCC34183]